MKFSVFCLALLFSFSVASAQVKQSTQQTSPSKSGVVVKKATTSTTTDRSPANQVVPSTQKKPVTPVNKNKLSVIPKKNVPTTTTKDITGYWLTANKGAIILFYKEGEMYHGKIVWQRLNRDRKGKLLTDVNNPDKTKRKNPLINTRMINNLKYNPRTRMYEGGRAYQPQTGRSFDCKVKLTRNNDAMEITAMGGFTLMSKTLYWSRTTGVPSK